MAQQQTFLRTLALAGLGLAVAGSGFFTLCSAYFTFALPGLWIAVGIGALVTWLLVRAFRSVQRGGEEAAASDADPQP